MEEKVKGAEGLDGQKGQGKRLKVGGAGGGGHLDCRPNDTGAGPAGFCVKSILRQKRAWGARARRRSVCREHGEPGAGPRGLSSEGQAGLARTPLLKALWAASEGVPGRLTVWCVEGEWLA